MMRTDYLPNRAAAVASNTTAFQASVLYVGGARNVVVDTEGGDTDVTFTACPVGFVLPVLVIG